MLHKGQSILSLIFQIIIIFMLLPWCFSFRENSKCRLETLVGMECWGPKARLPDCLRFESISLEIQSITFRETILISFVSAEIDEYSSITTFFNSIYARAKQYTFAIVNLSNCDSEILGDDKRWSKIAVFVDILQQLRTIDSIKTIAVLDADLVIMNSQFRVDGIVDKTAHVFMCEDALDFVNTGFMIMRNTPHSLQFFKEWMRLRESVPGVDQHVLNALISSLKSGEKSLTTIEAFSIRAPKEFNSIWPTITTYGPDDSVLHLMGETNKYRVVVFNWMLAAFERYLEDLLLKEIQVNRQLNSSNWECIMSYHCLNGIIVEDFEYNFGFLLSISKEKLQELYVEFWQQERHAAQIALNRQIAIAAAGECILGLVEFDNLIDVTGTLCDQLKRKDVWISDNLAQSCVLYYANISELLSRVIYYCNGMDIIPYLRKKVVTLLNVLWFVDNTTSIAQIDSYVADLMHTLGQLETQKSSNEELKHFIYRVHITMYTRRMMIALQVKDISVDRTIDAINWGLRAMDMLKPFATQLIISADDKRYGAVAKMHYSEYECGIFVEFAELAIQLSRLFTNRHEVDISEGLFWATEAVRVYSHLLRDPLNGAAELRERTLNYLAMIEFQNYLQLKIQSILD